jgi:alkylation response protein AidB-like acyl-CoA dehydrogenase
MPPAISSAQKTFRLTARTFLEKEYPLDRVRSMDVKPGFDRDWWQRAAELGWTALLVPEELGGGSVSDHGVLDLALLAEELGAGVAPGPLLAVNVVLAGLVEAQGTGPDQSAAIEALVAGESIASWAVCEPGREWSTLEPGLTATASADGGYRLTGVKDRVEAAEAADLFLVTATTVDGVAQFLVPKRTPGVNVRPQWSMDLARDFGEVEFDGVEVGAGARVGDGSADRMIERQLQIALLIQCAEVNGGLDRAFAFTLQWAFDRYTFGRQLASYQVLKHRFADLRTWLEACHATAAAAAVAVQNRADDAPELVSTAKAFVGERSLRILQDCVQIHGGIGVTWEHDLHLYLRRATVDQSLYGTPADHYQRLTDLASF